MSSLSRITKSTINVNLVKASYAVRGPIVSRSVVIAEELLKKDHKYKFSKIISCNIGNPHALGQEHISFVRNVLSIVINPSLLNGGAIFSKDVVDRAQFYLDGAQDIGSYTTSQGLVQVRQEIADFIERRDGDKSNPGDVFLTNGASDGVRSIMLSLLRDTTSGFKDGILTPIPQYPLYSALTTLLQGHQIPYYLDESNDWSCSTSQLTESLKQAVADGVCGRALVVINPGNPTGQILSEESIREIVTWCRTNGICLLADEVYQENIWKKGAKFVSFRRVAYELKAFEGENPLQLISFHSISKGFLGECGLRGGYFELLGFPADVKTEILKLASISLCSNTMGQIAMGLMVNPPKEGDLSYVKYIEEKNLIMDSLGRRARNMSNALNELEGISCTVIEGSLYAFPSIILPEKAVAHAHKNNIEADELYCTELLENTGIVVVPGSGFGQKEDTYHFRTTILPSEDSMLEVVRLLTKFHNDFLKRYK